MVGMVHIAVWSLGVEGIAVGVEEGKELAARHSMSASLAAVDAAAAAAGSAAEAVVALAPPLDLANMVAGHRCRQTVSCIAAVASEVVRENARASRTALAEQALLGSKRQRPWFSFELLEMLRKEEQVDVGARLSLS